MEGVKANDLRDRLIHREINLQNQKTLQMNISNLENKTYILKVNDNTQK